MIKKLSDLKNLANLIGEEKYFIQEGTCKNKYEWRIKKVKITGINISENKKIYFELDINYVRYTYPLEYLLEYLKDTLEEAKKFALEQIIKEKNKQIEFINSIKE